MNEIRWFQFWMRPGFIRAYNFVIVCILGIKLKEARPEKWYGNIEKLYAITRVKIKELFPGTDIETWAFNDPDFVKTVILAANGVCDGQAYLFMIPAWFRKDCVGRSDLYEYMVSRENHRRIMHELKIRFPGKSRDEIINELNEKYKNKRLRDIPIEKYAVPLVARMEDR